VKKRAAVAVGHSVLVAVRHLLRNPVALYHEVGPGYFDERHRQAAQRRLVRRLEGLRYTASLAPPTSAA
jgi:transposase